MAKTAAIQQWSHRRDAAARANLEAPRELHAVNGRRAIVAAVPGRDPRIRRHRVHRLFRIETGWKYWPDALPQHGPGLKHQRAIALEDWQQRIVDGYPWAFLRGLLHSDGCRTVSGVRTLERDRTSGVDSRAAAPAGLLGIHLN